MTSVDKIKLKKGINILLGLFITAASFNLLFLPNDLVVYDSSGLTIIIEHFFKYYEEHNSEKYDAETFRTILEDFVLYFYNLSIRRLEGQKSRCLSDISKAFSEQKELVGMIPAVNLESPTFVTQDEEDTLSLVYTM